MRQRKSGRGGSARTILLSALAIGAITASVLYILVTLNEERARLRPVEDLAKGSVNAGEAPEPAPEGTDPLEVRTKLVIDAKGGPGGRPIVLLAAPVCSAAGGSIDSERQGLMARELVRQAFLLAARDELGATTRDVVTGEVAKVDSSNSAGQLSSLFPRGKPARAFVRTGSGTSKDTLIEGDLGMVAANEVETPDDLAVLVERAEALSRGEFPGALKKLGVPAGQAVAWGDAPAPEGALARIDSLAFTESFAAVRLLHDAIRRDGESPARLAALARAYAMLGVLTEFQFRPAHKAYKARALLYAQRLVAKRPAHPIPYWNRAFVWMLVGRPKEALADLASASKRAESEPKVGPPDWVPVIDAAARHDVDRLGQAPAGAAGLASFLRMTLLEFPASPTLTTAAARDVLARAPECYRAIDAMCSVQALSDLHIATALGPQVLAQTLGARLKALPDRPAELNPVVDQEQGSFLPLTAALEAAGAGGKDSGELSWTALAELIRETNFVQLDRRMIFMKYAWAVPIDEFWAAAAPTVADHPLRPLLEWIAAAPAETNQAAARLAEVYDLNELEINQIDILRAFATTPTARGHSVWSLASGHLDHVARDLGLFARDSTPRAAIEKIRCARILLGLDPRSGFARAILVDHDFDRVKGHIDLWANEPDLAPELAVALAGRFAERNDEAQAVRLYEHAAALAPDRSTVEKLAAVYMKQGKMDQWRKILDDFIANGPDSGLDHAHAQVDIANYLMSKQKWDEAWPYAQAAAETWAGWAIECAESCAEARGDWETAEGYCQALSQRYPNRWWKWYLFCKTTGRGNATSAHAFTVELLKSIGDRTDLAAPEDRAYFHWASGDYKTASAEFESIHASLKNSDDLFRAFMTADAAGDLARRDALYKQFRDSHGKVAPKTIQMFDLLLAGTDKLKEGTLDLKPIDDLIESIKPENRWYSQFVVGQFIRHHGKPADALKYHTGCSRSKWVWAWMKAIASDSARAGASDLKSAFRLRASRPRATRAAAAASSPRA